MALVPLLLSVSLTNTYAQKYEPDGTNLAEVSGKWLFGVIVFGLLLLCGCGAGSAELLFAGAICLGICITLVSIIAGILISVSASKSDSSEGKAIGAAAAVFTFLVICTPWCLLTSCAVRLESGRSESSVRSRSYPRSPTSTCPAFTEPTILEKMSDEDKRKIFIVAMHYKENAVTGEDVNILTKIQQQYV